MSSKIKKIIFSLLAIVLSILVYFYQQIKTYQKQQDLILVTEVLDGDTLVIAPNQSIRLANIDTPEINLCLGQNAKDFLTNLILNKRVNIVSVGRDAYKRTIALIYLPDGQLVNEIVALNGMGIYTSTNTKEKEKINLAIESARDKKIGIFSQVCSQTENIDNSKCNIKGNIGKHDREKYYHLPECAEYNRTVVELHLGEKWFCNEKEAIESGYKKSKNCP
ncbi:MAG TPA: thermonuclease family protein [Candidatus Woesebacteria bacterium]|nr:thermonuclease family protein [Candidatus Woesebacteria bacterium]